MLIVGRLWCGSVCSMFMLCILLSGILCGLRMRWCCLIILFGLLDFW